MAGRLRLAPRAAVATFAAGFVAATLFPDKLVVEFHHLEQGREPAYTATIPRQQSP
jgi:hypothetical protein